MSLAGDRAAEAPAHVHFTSADDACDRMSDAELASATRQGDPRAFRAIMTRSNPRLYKIARSIVRDDSEAEDVVQESYLRAFAGLAGFRGDSRLTTWLTRIVINEARGRLRRRRPRVGVEVLETAQARGELATTPPLALLETPEQQTARTQARRLIEAAIAELPVDFRLVFLLRDIEHCTVEETAAALGIPAQTVKTRLFRARRRLRNALCATLASTLHDAFPFRGARCERMTAAVLARLEAQPRQEDQSRTSSRQRIAGW